MSLRLSTGIRDLMLGKQGQVVGALAGITLALTDEGASPDTITDSGNGFITQGFQVGSILYLNGCTTAANDSQITGVAVLTVAAGVITIPSGSVSTAETFLAGTVLAHAQGGSLRDIFKDGVLRIYSGSQPTNPDAATSGTLLLEISVDAGAFVHGAAANGLEFGAAASGAISKNSDTWQDTGIASGTAGWFRFCGNPVDNGASSTTLPRIDGTVGTSGADLNMTNTSITVGATYTIDTFTLTLPLQYGA